MAMERKAIRPGDSKAALHQLAAIVSLQLICAHLTLAFAVVNETTKAPLVPAVFLFGDSIVDAGNNNGIQTIFKADFPPYGKDFMGSIPTGRFSNGKVPGDFIASILGLKEIVPAYLSPNLGDQDLLTGVTFASGSTGYDPMTPIMASVISMPEQLNLFSEYKEKLKVILGEEAVDRIISKALFIVCAGTNDIANTYFTSLFRQPFYDVPTYVDLLITSASDFLQDLYKLGARRIGFVGLPPVGCLPFQMTVAGELNRKCEAVRNQAAELYNSKINGEIKRLSADFRGAKLVYLDIYTIFFDMIQRPKVYGFEVSDRGCCGTGIFEASILCTKRTPLCTDDTKYIFWDSFHPTETAFILLSFEIILHHIQCTANQTSPKAPAIIVFGDSIVDPGNNNAILTTVKCNFSPYGKDFIGHKATGRFSNGKIPSDFLASLLGIKEYVPAYLGSKLSASELITGVSFASGGCGFDPLTSELVSAISMDEQLNLFMEYKEKVKAILGEERAAQVTYKSAYLIITGSDDFANTYFTTPFRRFKFDIPSYINFTVQSASIFVQKLYHLGARRINIVGIPPIGCLPSQRTLAGGFERVCNPTYNEAAIAYNSQLSKEMQRLNSSLPKSKILYVDMYTTLLDIMLHPSDYGFEESKRGCCGTGTFEVTLTCNSLTTFICEDASKYVFWDSYHPTERAYKILMGKLVQKYGAFIN